MSHEHIEQLRSLVSLFSANIAQYKSGQYDEANTRTDFIDKLFTLLDWDIANNQGFSESYRDVVREDKVKIDGSQKAPDYSFRIGGVRKFFVEAKKPAVNIKEAAEPAYQVRRYAYTAKLPLSILTNFEEFAVYDTRIKPGKDDKASVGRVFYCTFDQYEQHFDFIHDTFSKDAILKGSFDKYVEENKNKKGTSEVDTELLSLVEEWRVELAKNIAKNNPGLSIYNLNTIVQKIIDRIVFLRIAEDKGIEDENLLLTVTQTKNIYEKLILLFKKANAKYNSGLFADVDWINSANIEDKVLSHIIVNLYYPECPYEFSVLPIEILGSIYERFLGKTIRLRAIKGDTHTAIIEEKPEVKKAGGVFYTPQYIVDYIVQNTVGEKIKDKSPDEIAGIKICDPACGSGSFLVGAYQYLLNYHLDYYTNTKNIKAALKTGKIYEAAFQSYKLAIEEKQRILTANIFGVDIDSQAVEVTKLSLYLKLLENEGKEAAGNLFKFSDLTILPSLEDNIKCGNSLIGTDFYAQPALDLSDDDRIKVNCFDWEKEFPAIFKTGGFDVVIGNPPWGADLKVDKSYFKEHFDNTTSDSAAYFLDQAQKLSKSLVGMIVPKTISYYAAWKSIREVLLNYCRLYNIMDAGIVFPGVNLESVVLIFEKNQSLVRTWHPDIFRAIPLKTPQIPKDIVPLGKFDTKIVSITNTFPMIGLARKETNLIQKLFNNSIKLGDIAKDIFRGLYISDNEKEQLRKGKTKWINKVPDVKRWYLSKVNLIALPNEYKTKAIKITIPRLFLKVLRGSRLIAFPDVNGEYLTTEKLVNITIKKGTYSESYLYLCGIINAKITSWYLQKVLFSDTTETARVMDRIYSQYIILPRLDLSDKADKAKHDKIVSLVEKMLELKQKEAAEPNQQLKTMIARQIDGVDKAIDTAVYGLYNLNDEEIQVVEGK